MPKDEQAGASVRADAPLLRMSMHFTLTPMQPPSESPQISTIWTEAAPIRREYREVRGNELTPLLEEALTASKSATEFAQNVIKNGFLLNGGGMVAIPAIVALFKLDTQKLLWMLLATGAAFIVGLLAAWSASICGFFALANRSDSVYSTATKTARNLEVMFFPPDAARKATLGEQAKAAEETAARHESKFQRLRRAGIILCFVTLVGFIAGVGFGALAIIKLQAKTEAAPPLSMPSAPS